MASIVAVAVDPEPAVRRVFALDSAGATVLVTGLDDGTPGAEGAWPLPDWPGQPGWVDLAVGREGVAVLHAGARRVALFDPGTGESRGSLSLDAPALPLRLAARPGGGWVAALVDRTLLAIDEDGRARTSIAMPEEEGAEGQPLGAPSDVWVDQAGRIYVADLEARAVHRLGLPASGASRLHLPWLLRVAGAIEAGVASVPVSDRARP
jgi:hypothetical protein